MLADLSLASAALAGATSLTLSGARAEGRIVEGARFSIAGVGGVYEVAEDAAASNEKIVVEVTSGLVAPAGEGAAITFTQPYASNSFPSFTGSRVLEDKKQVEAGAKVRLLSYVDGHPEPEPGDEIEGVAIVAVQPVEAGGGVAYWRVTEGEGG